MTIIRFFFTFLTFSELLPNGHAQYPCHCACNCYCSQPQTYCGNVTSSTCPNDYFRKPRDCKDIYEMGFGKTGGYIIYPIGHPNGIYVRCDMDTAGGGWTVIQRRVSADVDFFRGWVDYKEGFGDQNGNLWLGNDNIHDLTAQAQADNQLHITLAVSNTNSSFATYETFSVGNESSGYLLNVKSYSGTAGDSFSYHSGMKFSTKDVDNDKISLVNCASIYKGGWWYNNCHFSNLNGIYGSTNSGEGINWYNHAGHQTSMSYADMKIKRKVSQ